ncbi:MAG: hypothetical protein LW884_02080 [Bacteroidetes bacterium]|jgi:hypothetical protein|nr:hypothetical protein [Bacteroidota bacterium]
MHALFFRPFLAVGLCILGLLPTQPAVAQTVVQFYTDPPAESALADWVPTKKDQAESWLTERNTLGGYLRAEAPDGEATLEVAKFLKKNNNAVFVVSILRCQPGCEQTLEFWQGYNNGKQWRRMDEYLIDLLGPEQLQDLLRAAGYSVSLAELAEHPVIYQLPKGGTSLGVRIVGFNEEEPIAYLDFVRDKFQLRAE